MIKWKNISLKSKLIVLFMAVGLFPLVLLGWFAAFKAGEALIEKSSAQLKTIQQIRKRQIESYFIERLNDIEVLSSDGDIIAGMKHFNHVFNSFKKQEKAQTIICCGGDGLGNNPENHI